MFKLRGAVLLSTGILLSCLLPPGIAAQDLPPAEWSVDADLPIERSPAERIQELNRQIMDLRARGLHGHQLGHLFNDLGVIHARQEDWPQARDAFIHAVQAKPADPDFHRNLGMVFLHLDDLDLAISSFEVYRDLTGGRNADAYRLLALAYTKIDAIEQARESYQQGLKNASRSPGPEVCRLVLGLARLEREQGDAASVRGVLEAWHPMARAWRERAVAEGLTDGVQEAITIENNLLFAYMQDGQMLEEANLIAEALELYEKAHAIAPERDGLLSRIVAAHLVAGDVFQARVVVQLARQNHPDRAGTWLAAARIHEAEDDQKKALEAYKRAYELAPDTPGLRMKLGNLLIRQGSVAEGRRLLAEIIEAEDTPTDVVYNYAVSLMRDQLFAAAVAPLQRVTRENPQFAGGWLALAQAHRGRQQYSRAVDAYQKALELQPDARTAYNLGVTAGQAELWDAALAGYARALELDPDHREAAYNRAVALMQAGRLAAADSAFASYRQLDGEHYRASLNHGVTLYRMGRYEEAIDVYYQALEIQETAEAWNNLGLVYQELGDKEKAERCFKEAEKLHRGS